VSDPVARGLPAFKSIREPHEAVHEMGRQVLLALRKGDLAAAQHRLAELERQSHRVVEYLAAFSREYRETFVAKAA
jgi:hypothetical protein